MKRAECDCSIVFNMTWQPKTTFKAQNTGKTQRRDSIVSEATTKTVCCVNRITVKGLILRENMR